MSTMNAPEERRGINPAVGIAIAVAALAVIFTLLYRQFLMPEPPPPVRAPGGVGGYPGAPTVSGYPGSRAGAPGGPRPGSQPPGPR